MIRTTFQNGNSGIRRYRFLEKRRYRVRHGVFSAHTVLPGEDPAEFKKLLEKITVQYNAGDDPDLQLELTSLARLLWRRQSLVTYPLATEASRIVHEINAELIPRQRIEFEEYPVFGRKLVGKPPTAEEIHAGEAKAREQIQKELGDFAKLAAMSGIACSLNCRR